MRRFLALFACISFQYSAQAQYNPSKFHQLEEWWPTPNEQRTGSGAPGHQYWQQRCDYKIDVTLDDEKQRIKGTETLTYTNNSPDALTYLWLQIDQNIFDKNSESYLTETKNKLEDMDFEAYNYLFRNNFDGGVKIDYVKDASGNPLKFTINKTMMRIDLPNPLKTGAKFSFNISWNYNINNHKTHGGRTGYEYFEKDKNYLYEMAHWFPRMCVYDDVDGWQHKQYLGRGEFALEFGDYQVNITVPSDHIVASTGVLQNPKEVLTSAQQTRFEQAKTSNKPLKIVTQDEAIQAEGSKSTTTKTWKFFAQNVRDFAWASSRKFIWDAMGVKVGQNTILAMSFYPKEGNPLWEMYSTQAIAHTLRVYSRYTVNYAYPVAISVNGPVGGMEYPMICFNGPRPEADGTYTARSKYGLISVVIHEVGHNFFPMIINSDERQWTWMDEGLNTFCQYLAEKEWEPNYPTRRGEPAQITSYMGMEKSALEPIMSNSESIIQFGNNAYSKTATALNILRETVMGRELFDYSFKVYAERWAYKHPMPADFFRTMEDASGIDLDWFWRGWFYSTDAVDMSINNVTAYRFTTQNPEIDKVAAAKRKNEQPKSIAKQRDEKAITHFLSDDYPELLDFYSKYDELKVTEYDKKKYQYYLSLLDAKEKAILEKGLYFYVVDVENIGGLVMPLIFELTYEDGTKEIQRIPAEIFKLDNKKVSKLFIAEKLVKQIILDPFKETADIDLKNNSFPRIMQESQFQIFKQQQQQREKNLMQLEKEGRL